MSKEIDVPVGKKIMLAVKSLDKNGTVEIIRVECVEGADQNRCSECAFRHREECHIYQCYSVFRKDGKEVYYKKIEVVDQELKKKIMSREFDLDAAVNRGATLRTRGGYPARIVATDAKGKYPIVALVDVGSEELALRYTKEGRVNAGNGIVSNYDLVTEEKRYINLFRRGKKFFVGRPHMSVEMAKDLDGYILAKYPGSVYVDTIEVTL